MDAAAAQHTVMSCNGLFQSCEVFIRVDDVMQGVNKVVQGLVSAS